MTFQRGQFLHRVAGAAAVPVGTDKRTILRGHYLFGKLTPQHIDRLSACIVTKTVKRGTNIFAKGIPGPACAPFGVFRPHQLKPWQSEISTYSAAFRTPAGAGAFIASS
jgi:hypothetical protein